MPPRLGINHLQMLAAIVETGAVTDAAQVLCVTPSAMNHRIREPSGVWTSPSSRELVAVRLLDELEQVETPAQKMGYGIKAVVRLGIATYSSYHWPPDFLNRLHEAAPAFEAEVVANAVQRPFAALQEGDIDLAVAPDVLIPAGMTALPLFDDELVAIMSPGHRLAARDIVEAADFRDHDVPTYSFTNLPGHELDLFWRPAGVSPHRIIRVELIDAVVYLVKANPGGAIVQRWAMAPHLDDGRLAACRLTQAGIRIPWSVALRSTSDHDSAVATVADQLADWCRAHEAGFGATG